MASLAVSSIAWTNEEESVVAEKLQELGVEHVELAPTKYWEDPTKATPEQVKERVDWWKGYGINIVAFQSMLFARPGLKLFESAGNRAECLQYLQEFIVLAGRMGAKRMVFGSPKNRQRGDMSHEDAFAIASDFFTEIAKTAEENDVVFCLEPNARQYNCDFITNAQEGAELVRAVGRSGFGLHLDAACMALAGDDIAASIRQNIDILEHFHVSAPMLDRVHSRDDMKYKQIANLLHEVGYDKVISIEMRPGEAGENLSRVEAAVLFVQSTFAIS